MRAEHDFRAAKPIPRHLIVKGALIWGGIYLAACALFGTMIGLGWPLLMQAITWLLT